MEHVNSGHLRRLANRKGLSVVKLGGVLRVLQGSHCNRIANAETVAWMNGLPDQETFQEARARWARENQPIDLSKMNRDQRDAIALEMMKPEVTNGHQSPDPVTVVQD